MKTVLAVVLTALVTSSGAYAVERAVTPGQFAALKRQVTTLQKRQNIILGYIGVCLSQWKPISQFNNYLAYDHSTNQAFETTAVDLTGSGETPSFFAPTASQDCTLSSTRDLSQVFDRATVSRKAAPQSREH